VAWVLLAACALLPLLASAQPRLLPVEASAVEPIRPPWAVSVSPGPWRATERARALRLGPRPSPLESELERSLRIAEHRPAPVEPSPGSAGRRAAALNAARLFEAAGDFEAARFSYERAVAMGADDQEVWRALARARLRTGDGPAAEGALLATLDRLGETTDAIAFVELRAQIHRNLAKIYLLDGRGRDAQIALEGAEGLALVDGSTSLWLVDNLLPLRLETRPLPGAPPPVWPEAPEPAWSTRAVDLAAQAHEALPSGLQEELDEGLAWANAGDRPRILTMTLLGALVLLVILRLIRQRGDLIVAIEYPEELRGLFRVRLATKKARAPSADADVRAEVQKGGISTHYEHHWVNRETQFHRLLSRRYHVFVEGVLMDPDTEEILADYADEKVMRVRHRRTVRLEYDAHPEKCPVDVTVMWDDKAADDVAVVAEGELDTLRQASPGVVRLFLDKGRHRLVVGCGDRVMAREVDVSSFQPTRVVVDLAGSEVVFKGCPPAVGPYLRGDIESVAQALERDGQSVLAYRLLAQVHRDRGENTRAADFFESAGDHLEAAELRASFGDWIRAAKLFLQADAPVRAAEMYEAAGDLVKSGQAYEVAHDFDRAIECYQEANAVDRWIGALERRGEAFQAAKVALGSDQRSRAIRLLQCIAAEDTDFAEASWMLSEAFEREGHYDLAAQKLEQHIGTFKLGSAPADKYSKLADLLELASLYERALDVLEDLRRREPTYPGVASRIENLRKQRSAADRMGRTTGTITAGDAPTAFVSEYRYEILEEIGRGGMGVVFKARDRRLDRIVALKRLPEDLRRHQPRAVQLFLREAQAAARLNHPNIVTVFDTDQEDGVFFITMELLSGEPFNKILKERGALSPTGVVEVGMQVAAGLEYAHDQGIVHRDIKTANLFLTDDNVVKVMDFGLAKMFEEVRGGTTMISGTPFYMSPEQILGSKVDQRTDLYSLGVTLFELSTGQVPFTQGEVAYHHRHTEPPDPRSLRPELPEALSRILLDLLVKDPERRCASAADLLRRLSHLAASPTTIG
jgi:tetratricopeptide (TPR) repeat protein